MHSRPQEQEVTATDFSGDLKVSGDGISEHYVGSMHQRGGNRPITSNPHPSLSPVPVDLEIELDRKRVEAIEDIRVGKDLTFKLVLSWVASQADNKKLYYDHTEMQYRAYQSVWIEALERMRYTEMMLLEVPLLKDEASGRFPKAVKFLKQAQEHVRRGQYREAVGVCRDALEALATVLPDAARQVPGNKKERSKEDRLLLVRRALKNLTHPAHHGDDASQSIEWDRTDAVGVLSITTMLVQMAAAGK